MDRWKDRVAVVTGASSGIGAAVASRLVQSGMIVVGAARRSERLQELSAKLPEDRFYPMKCDVTSEQDIIQLFQEVDKKLGRVDVLINNAGVAHFTSLIEPSNEALQSLFATNCIGPCLCTREALKIMKKHNIETGYIMYTNSVAGHSIAPSSPGAVQYYYAYSGTKHALKAIVEGLRQELRANGSKIRVGEVSPGMVTTEIGQSFTKTDADKKYSEDATKQMERYAEKIEKMQSDDIAEAFVYMLSAPERADVNEIIVSHSIK